MAFFFYIFKRNTDFYTREIIVEKEMKEDVRQELYLIAIEIKKQKITNIKEIRKYIARRIYEFLKKYGFRKKREINNPKKIIWWFDWEKDFSKDILLLTLLSKVSNR